MPVTTLFNELHNKHVESKHTSSINLLKNCAFIYFVVPTAFRNDD